MCCGQNTRSFSTKKNMGPRFFYFKLKTNKSNMIFYNRKKR